MKSYHQRLIELCEDYGIIWIGDTHIDDATTAQLESRLEEMPGWFDSNV